MEKAERCVRWERFARATVVKMSARSRAAKGVGCATGSKEATAVEHELMRLSEERGD